MLAIKNNIMAANAARHLGKSYDALATSVERLASGLRINSAKDDAAGLAVRELIRADIAVLQQGSRNASDGISMLQTMEGAMAVVDDNLIRMKELAEQAATGSYSTAQRTIMNAEFSEMADEIDRIAAATAFNGIAMLDGSSSAAVEIHVGTTDTISVARQNMTTGSSGLDIAVGTGGFEVMSQYGVSTTGGTFLTIANSAGAEQTVELTIQFSETGVATEDMLTITFTAAATNGTDYTLQQVVDLINLQSQNLGNDANGASKNYNAATVSDFNTDYNLYYLKIGSRLTGSDTLVEMKLAADTDTVVDGAIDLASGAGATTIAENDGWANDTDPATAVAFEQQAGTGINISDIAGATAALVSITSAITAKDEARAAFGYKMNRLESTIAILDIQAENLMSAESRISDVDVATEMATLTRTQVLSQAGISMLAQANTMPQMALSLLR